MAAIYTGYIYGRDAIVAQELYDFGILSWPHGPDVEPGYTFGVIENIYSAVAIPITSPEPTYTAFLLNALYEPLEGYENRQTVQEYMTHNYFFDERDARVLANMLENTEYGFFLEGARGVIESVTETDTSLTSLLESNEDKYEQIVEDYMVHHYEGTVAVYGE